MHGSVRGWRWNPSALLDPWTPLRLPAHVRHLHRQRHQVRARLIIVPHKRFLNQVPVPWPVIRTRSGKRRKLH